MPKVKVIPVSEARPSLTRLIEEVSQGNEPYLIASHSRVKAVLLGIDQYNDLLERIEDLEDSLDILRARERKEPSRPFEEFVQELKTDREDNVQG